MQLSSAPQQLILMSKVFWCITLRLYSSLCTSKVQEIRDDPLKPERLTLFTFDVVAVCRQTTILGFDRENNFQP